ncbi:MAG TPA: hypothetical protein DCY48_04645 [Candidatus Magasanikbacteria bacterium]|nr:MAG: hypothetical protein A3I74_03135 [Candidatus Magasanikbacteria bacterium RIFCSPLOWO2_02_FULL_47_16]OGH80206.1 MAG: hypothetical protein A3C10_03415 [Candidatus Magasanikbacteria bacterium RIFCSPHIGHO2_02_FULL_48_18]HAZ29030.1 hypothetical protein [Candidatus Magasanikbacteria bacterium]
MFKKISKILYLNRWVFVFAFLIAILTAVPQMIQIRSLGESFEGIYPIFGSDDLYYLARGRDSIDAHSKLGNPYLFEYKNYPTIQFWIPDYFLARSLTLIGLDIFQSNIFFDGVFPFFLFILTFAVIYLSSRDRIISFAGAVFLHAGLFLELFGRSPSPQINFLFFLLVPLFLFNYFHTKNIRWAILLGVALGCLFYVYTYYWTFYFVYLFLLCTGIYLSKTGKEYLRGIFLSFVVACLLGVPYIVDMLHNVKIGEYADTMARLGMLSTHFPSGIRMVGSGALLFFLGAICLRKKIISKNIYAISLLSGVIAGPLVANHHIITGKNLEFSSHYWMPAVFWFVFFVCYVLSRIFSFENFKERKSLYIKILFIGIFIFSFRNAFYIAVRQSVVTEQIIDWQGYGEVMQWLDSNTDKDDVVFADDELSNLIPMYTHNNVFYSRFANLHFISNKEVENRFLINQYWNTLEYSDFVRYERSIWGTQFINAYAHNQSKNKVRRVLFLRQISYERLPQDAMRDIQHKYTVLKQEFFPVLVKPYRLDYIVWDTEKHADWNLDQYNFFTQVHEIDNFKIYSFDAPV